MKKLLITIIILSQCIFAKTDLKLNKNVTVSGISSGGYFAHQFHLINSDFVNGAAIFAAGPFYCARGNALTAMKTCMEGQFVEGTSLFSYNYLNTLQYSGMIDPLSNLKDDHIFLFSGTYDEVVHQSVTNELNDLYLLLGVNDLKYVNDVKAAHTYPTLVSGGDCTKSEIPFIGSCQYDGALKSLKALYPQKSLRNERGADKGRLEIIDQTKFFGLFDFGFNSPLLMDEAYLYIPKYCESNTCDLHVAFHGCKQSLDDIGMDYIQKTGITEAADQLDLVVLFPQAKRSRSEYQNPNACWDWWGYSGLDYSLRSGQQVRVITSLVKSILKGSVE